MSCVSLGTTGDGDSSQMVQKWLPSFWWVLLVPYLSGPQFPQLSEKLWLDLWFLKEEVSNFLINLKGWDTKKKKVKKYLTKGSCVWLLFLTSCQGDRSCCWCWSWSVNPLATWYKELTHRKTSHCWENLRAGRTGGNRGWDGWMASLTQWT